jgi:hypothetical protein
VGTETTYFLYDGPRIIEERDAAGTPLAQYVYGNYVDEVLQMKRDVDEVEAGLETFYYHQDDLFNVRTITDIDGTPVDGAKLGTVAIISGYFRDFLYCTPSMRIARHPKAERKSAHEPSVR